MPLIDVSKSFGQLAAGSYVGIVQDKEYKVNEKTGTMKVFFKVSIKDEEGNAKTYRTTGYPVEGKGVYYVYQALQNMGADVPKKFELDDVQIRGLKAEFKNSERAAADGKKYFDLEPVKPIGKASDEELLDLESGAPF
jgi:hypothetical protein